MASFRFTDEDVERFRKFCEDNGYASQSEAFSALLETAELNNALDSMPENAADIKDFAALLSKITHNYTAALQKIEDADMRAETKYTDRIKSKDQTIKRTQDDLAKAEAARDDAVKKYDDADKKRIQAETERDNAITSKELTEHDLEGKKADIDRLTKENVDLKKKADAYDAAVEQAEAAEKARQQAEKEKGDAVRKAEDDLKEAKRQAERDVEKAVKEAQEKAETKLEVLREQLDRAKDQLFDTIQKKDAEREKALGEAQAKISALQDEIRSIEAKHASELATKAEENRKEVADLHAKLDSRAEEMMAAQKTISDLKTKLAELTHTGKMD